ncbi:MAG: LysO family transporter [Muribaculaceae bacterium]|nr:LysO family transporter [Muribaculaceae bacterium]
MLIIVAIMFCGIAVGYLLRNHNLRLIPQAIILLIWLLLFFLGVEVGENPRIIAGLKDLGLEAVWLSVMGIVGSVLLAWALWRYIQAKKGGKP